ncbi:hypothetical protein [Streptomyces sp. cg35]|uniref:hypothetical protein n=1 Tax=Streptomyces sp. cg35 TaxID=3421650 RepID=UPI003D183DB1
MATRTASVAELEHGDVIVSAYNPEGPDDGTTLDFTPYAGGVEVGFLFAPEDPPGPDGVFTQFLQLADNEARTAYAAAHEGAIGFLVQSDWTFTISEPDTPTIVSVTVTFSDGTQKVIS